MTDPDTGILDWTNPLVDAAAANTSGPDTL